MPWAIQQIVAHQVKQKKETLKNTFVCRHEDNFSIFPVAILIKLNVHLPLTWKDERDQQFNCNLRLKTGSISTSNLNNKSMLVREDLPTVRFDLGPVSEPPLSETSVSPLEMLKMSSRFSPSTRERPKSSYLRTPMLSNCICKNKQIMVLLQLEIRCSCTSSSPLTSVRDYRHLHNSRKRKAESKLTTHQL